MKKSELRKLVSEYQTLKTRFDKSKDTQISEKLEQIEHRYFHETGRDLKSDLK
jgi:hypothetical protein